MWPINSQLATVCVCMGFRILSIHQATSAYTLTCSHQAWLAPPPDATHGRKKIEWGEVSPGTSHRQHRECDNAWGREGGDVGLRFLISLIGKCRKEATCSVLHAPVIDD